MTRTQNSTIRLALAVGAALAAAQAAAAPGADAGKLEDVVVTAQRRAESAQDVGIALSVLNVDDLKDAGVGKVNDLQNATPNLEVEPAFGSGQPQFRLRGVGFIDYTSNNSSPVGVSVDGVALPFPIQTQGQLFDVSRVEVLRGPQGTLYGRNTTGGAINFITNRPTDTFRAGVEASYGSHQAFESEAFVSGPLAESLTGRLSVATESGGAWQRNRDTGELLGDKDKVAARAQLAWKISDGTDVRLTLHTSRDKSDAYGLQLFSPFTPAPVDAQHHPIYPTIPADTSPYATGWSVRPAFATAVGVTRQRPGVDNANSGASFDINSNLGGVTLTSITALNKLARRELNDWDATQYYESDVYFQSEAKSFSEEVRLASNGAGPLGWVAGAYYANDKLHEAFNNDFAQRLGGAARTEYSQDGKTFGLFEQSNYKFTDSLKGILGLRYEHETRNLDNLTTLFATGNPTNFADVYSASSNPGGATFNLSGGAQNRPLSNSGLSGKIGLEFQLAPHELIYASLSRGEKSGGFTAHNTLTPAAVDPFKPEKLTSLEVGLKADLASTLRLNAAVFHYEYRDQQILSKIYDPVSDSDVGRIINAPKSRIDGAEVELQWTPLAGLDFSQYVGYKKGKFTDTILNSDGVDFNGRDIDFPKVSYGGELGYTVPVGEFNLRTEVNYSYHDKYAQLFLLGPAFTVDSYWLANASVTVSPQAGSKWSATIWAHNVTNQKYFLTKNYFLPGTQVAAAGEPTTLGIRLKWSF